MGQPKMAIPILKRKDHFDTFSNQMLVYTKLHSFENVFDTDEYVDVGADGNDKGSLMAQGVSRSMYEKQLMAWVFFHKLYNQMVIKLYFTAVRLEDGAGSIL